MHQKARSLSAPSAAWQQVLADGIQDLVADVEHDLAARLRTVLRDARDIIDESDPKDTWEETQGWLRRQVAEAGVANRDLLLRRANELSDSVAEQFSLESGSRRRAGAGLGDPCPGRPRAPLGIDLLDARGTAGLGPLQRPAGGVRPAHGVERGPPHTLLIIPPAALLGAVVGRKLSRWRASGRRPIGRARRRPRRASSSTRSRSR